MLTPRNFSGSSNPVVDKMSQNPLSGGRLPIWDDNHGRKDANKFHYLAALLASRAIFCYAINQ